MGDDVTMSHRLSLAGRQHKIVPVIPNHTQEKAEKV